MIIEGLSLRIGGTDISITQFFAEGRMHANLRSIAGDIIEKYGTYSIRLYQYGHFIKLAEFTLMPAVVTNYSPYVPWTEGIGKLSGLKYKFERIADVELEFGRCHCHARFKQQILFREKRLEFYVGTSRAKLRLDLICELASEDDYQVVQGLDANAPYKDDPDRMRKILGNTFAAEVLIES